MPIEKHVNALLSGMDAWNQFNARTSDNLKYDFSGADLSSIESFKGYQFGRPANFSGAKFRKLAFKASTFERTADFSRIEVEATVEINVNQSATSLNFIGSIFNGVVKIIGSGTPVELNFASASFKDLLVLTGEFRGQLNFEKARFSETVVSDNAQFHDLVLFVEAVHEGLSFSFSSSSFHGAEFRNFRSKGIVDFSNAEFHHRTNFRGAVFERAPLFHGAKLHQETQFNPPEEFDVQFPDVTIEPAESRYRTLKFHMIAQHAIAEQLAFGRLELKSRARRQKIWWLSIFGIYEIFSDYGMSWIRPLLWLAGALGLEWLALWFMAHSGMPFFDPRLSALSIANAVPYLGTLKAFVPRDIDDLFPEMNVFAVELISVGFGIFATVMIFLIALGIRNRLRLK